MEILARAVGRRKEAVAQVQIVRGTGQLIINDKIAQEYLHNNSCSLLAVKAPFDIVEKTNSFCHSIEEKLSFSTPSENENPSITSNSSAENFSLQTFDTIVKVKGGGLIGQAEAIKLGIARALCEIESKLVNKNENSNQQATEIRKQLRTNGYLTQDSRIKERRKYGLKKARKASQYHKR
jgi:small subunit ribosomal protein S9